MDAEATRYCWDRQRQGFVLGETAQVTATGQGRKRPVEQAAFIKGPIPLKWLERAAHLPGKSINAALALWYVRSVTRHEQFTVKRQTWERLNLSRQAYYRALRDLETQGLIAVERKAGRYPVITLLNAQTDCLTMGGAETVD